MGMALVRDPYEGLTKWQRRAKRNDFLIMNGKTPEQMTDAELEAFFKSTWDKYGFTYVWGD